MGLAADWEGGHRQPRPPCQAAGPAPSAAPKSAPPTFAGLPTPGASCPGSSACTPCLHAAAARIRTAGVGLELYSRLCCAETLSSFLHNHVLGCCLRVHTNGLLRVPHATLFQRPAHLAGAHKRWRRCSGLLSIPLQANVHAACAPPGVDGPLHHDMTLRCSLHETVKPVSEDRGCRVL